MASDQVFTVTANQPIARATYRLTLAGDTSDIHIPGQFVNIELPGYYLRRPFSVADWDEGALDLIYKILGQGTASMPALKPGEAVPGLSGLGNGFSIEDVQRPLIVGGGVGVAPMFALTRALVQAGQDPTVVLGYNSADEVFLAEEIGGLGVPVTITTLDGTAGTRGFVTDALPAGADYLYACGPTPMLKALQEKTNLPGQYSLEERMGCGFGACMGCVVRTKRGMERVCKEGPVFHGEELEW